MKKQFNLTIILLTILSLTACFIDNSKSTEEKEKNIVKKVNQASMGVNLDYLTYYMPSSIFLNIFKEGSSWNGIDNFNLDENGWVKSFNNGKTQAGRYYKKNIYTYNTGTYVCTYEGEGYITFGWDAKVTSREGNRVEFEVASTSKEGFYISISDINSENYPKNIKIFEKKYEDLINKGETFYPELLEKLKTFNTLRFMEWGRVNSTVIVDWEDRVKKDYYEQTNEKKGVAIEYMIQLANETNTDPWICVPTRASDEYIRNMAKLIKENLNENLKFYLEYSNESWNWAFGQSIYMHEEFAKSDLEKPKGFYQDRLLYYSNRCKEIFKIFEEVYGGTSKFVRVAGGQNASATVSYEIVAYQDNYEYFDALAVAPYFTANRVCTDEYRETHPEDPTVEEIVQVCKEDLYKSIEGIEKNKIIADRYGLDLIAYEGGHHLVISNSDYWSRELDYKYIEAAFHPNMEGIYTDYLNAWKKAGGDLFVHYKLIDGRWGLFKNMTDFNSSKYNAVKDFMNKNPKWW